MHHASVWILSWHCNCERISWSGTQGTWGRLEVSLLSVGHYGSSNIDNLYIHLRKIQRDFGWCYWWFNKTFLYHKAKNLNLNLNLNLSLKMNLKFKLTLNLNLTSKLLLKLYFYFYLCLHLNVNFKCNSNLTQIWIHIVCLNFSMIIRIWIQNGF